MKTIKVKDYIDIPDNFTGKVEFENGTIEYFLNGKFHRLDGPAVIGYDGYKSYCINEKRICDSSSHENPEQIFYSSKEYKQAILLENMKRIKNISE